MRLFIAKDQASGMLGGIKFQLSARVELTNEEAALVWKYKADKEVLLQKEIKIPLTGRAIVLNLSIGNLMSGQVFKCNDIAEILEYEKNIKESCEAFKNYLEVMKNFGGQEVYEFNQEVASVDHKTEESQTVATNYEKKQEKAVDPFLNNYYG